MSSGEDKIRAKIKELEFEYARTQKNKATDQGGGKGKGGGGGERGFEVSKAGDTRVGLVGFPSVGKSTLLTKLTGTFSLAAGYEFTTLTAIPGTMHYRGAKIQILDLPGIIEGAKDGKGRGRQVLAAALTCNFERREKGPINFQAMVPQSVLTQEMVQRICKEYKINSADVFCREDATVDQLIDVIEGNRTYIPCIYVLNKIDQLTIEELDIIDQMPHHVPISAHQGWNLEELLERIWDYTKIVENFCERLHKQLLSQFKYAWVWGSSVRHQPQKVGKDHVLADEDVIQIVKKI
eukprot:GSChrysophyteH1.ASY1.ANO1.346.1 assembled CDS